MEGRNSGADFVDYADAFMAEDSAFGAGGNVAFEDV
jgi:hypothetical protein